MYGHLVAVEVGVERRADHRMDPDRLAFHQHRLERLDAEAMQRRGPVQKHRMPVDDMLEDLPDLGSLLVHHLLGALDGLHHPRSMSLRMMNGLKSSTAMSFGRPHSWEPQLGSDHDHRAAGIVHALAEKVLAEAPLLSLEHIGQRFERAIIVAPHRVDPPRVVKEGVDRLCSIRFSFRRMTSGALMSIRRFRRLFLMMTRRYRSLRSEVAKPSALERHQRPELRRDHRDDIQDHPLGFVDRSVFPFAEGFDHPKPLQRLELLLGGGLHLDLLAQLLGELVDVGQLQEALHGIAADLGNEPALVRQLEVVVVFRQCAQNLRNTGLRRSGRLSAGLSVPG